jgi:tetratricopeptide (TPR) repeat protein
MIMIGSQSFADVAAAVAALRPVAEAAPEDIVALKTLAEAHALGGETEEALALYARATALAGDAHGHARLGELLMRSGRAREAEENFDRAVTLGALSGRWSERIVRDYCELADLYFSEFDLESALRCHGRATEICPTYPDSATAALLKKHIFSTFSAVEGVVPAAADGGPECHAAGVIWGEDYCRFFTDYTLPSLLSAGNLPELAARERLLFSVYATPDAIAAIDAAPAFRQLKSFAEVLFIELPEALLELTRGDWIDKATRYRNTLRIVAAHHDMASRLAKQKGAAVFYVIPDWVVSEGCFARMHDITRAGKDICVFPVLVVNREAMAPILDANRGTPGEGITLSPERLSALAVEHLHPSWEQFRARGGGFHARQFPSWMLWPFDDKGLILHTFYWSTVYVTARGLEN